MTVLLLVILALDAAGSAGALRREGRSLRWAGRPVQLVGYSYYGLLADRSFDADAFLGTLAAHNINFTRFFLILPWPVEPGPNLLPFAKRGEKYDLRKFNDAFFVRLRAVVTEAERLGIICQVCLFDRCGLSVDDRRAWPNNPYNGERNVNGLLAGPKGGYPPFCHTTGAIAEINAAFIRKVVETLGDAGNVMYELINEPYRQLGPLKEWHAWAARVLRRNLAGRPGSAVLTTTGPYDDPEIDVFSMHTAGRERDVDAALQTSRKLGKPVILSDDGDPRCMFNPDVTRASAVRALDLGQHFEHLEFTIAQQREQAARPASRLDQLPGLARLNLRRLAEVSTPLPARPFVRTEALRRADGGFVLIAQMNHADCVQRIIGERSEDEGGTWSSLPATIEKGVVRVVLPPARHGVASLARAACVGRGSQLWPGPAQPYGPAGECFARLGDEIVEAGLIRIRPHHGDGVMQRVARGGRNCDEVNLHRRGRYAYFRLADWVFPNAAPPRVTATVEYFDQPAGAKLVLEYDGVSAPYTAARSRTLEGSATWKTATFTVRDPRFGHRQNDGADLRFSLQDPVAPLALRAVRVRGDRERQRRTRDNGT